MKDLKGANFIQIIYKHVAATCILMIVLTFKHLFIYNISVSFSVDKICIRFYINDSSSLLIA